MTTNLTSSPPSEGFFELAFPHAPVSFQTSSSRKERIRQIVQEATRSLGFLLAGDVQVEIEWLIHEQERYESDASADVDNIIKPILDALCGTDGILIDDCQVQSISCSWVDTTDHQQQFSVRVRFFPDEWIERDGLSFLHLGRGLCVPINTKWDSDLLGLFVHGVETMMAARDEILSTTGDYYFAKRFMPQQRIFHRSKVDRYTVVDVSNLKAGISAGAAAS